VQAAIRTAFASATVLTVAHRLHTIMDSTLIMVFDQGTLKEHATPEVLLANEASLFAALVRDTGSTAGQLHKLATDAALVRQLPLSPSLSMAGGSATAIPDHPGTAVQSLTDRFKGMFSAERHGASPQAKEPLEA